MGAPLGVSAGPSVVARVGTSITAALMVAAGAAWLESHWAALAATQPLQPARAWLVAFSLLSPVCLLVGFVTGVVHRALHDPLASSLRHTLSEEHEGTRGGSLVPMGFAVSVCVALCARLALRLFAADLRPVEFSLALAFGVALLARVVLGVALRFSANVARGLRLHLRPLALNLCLAVAAVVAPLAYGAYAGTTNGEGGFWAPFGVLLRKELDLRASGVLALLVAGAYVAPLFGSLRKVSAAFGVSLALAGLVATGVRLLDDDALGLALQRGGALSRVSLGLLRRVSDADGDGESRFFGGRDCDDRRPEIFPGAVDVPDNGVDEDCSGRDAHRARRPVAWAPASDSPRKWIAERLVPELNVVLITIDTLRHDLGYAGYPRAISKHLDRLAQRSVVFERAYALASYTGKSLGPMLIGRYPSETHRGWRHFNRFGPRNTFVQERLQQAGIRTLSVQGHWYFTPEYGLGRGFDVLDLSAKPRKRQLEGDRTVNSHRLTDAAIAQLSKPENVRDRFFLWVHYLDPHAEYIRHAAFDFGRRGRDSYDSEVAYTDHHVGRLLEFLSASDLAEKTAIIVTSDHGEAFGEHGMWRHGFELWEPLVRVPLIAFVPGVRPQRHTVRRGAIDLAPTLLQLFGLPLPVGADRLSGESLLEDIFMPPGHVPRSRPVFIDMSAGPYNQQRQALIEGDVKLIAGRGRFLNLYDLSDDPDEERDRIRDVELFEQMRQRFEEFKTHLRPVHVAPR